MTLNDSIIKKAFSTTATRNRILFSFFLLHILTFACRDLLRLRACRDHVRLRPGLERRSRPALGLTEQPVQARRPTHLRYSNLAHRACARVAWASRLTLKCQTNLNDCAVEPCKNNGTCGDGVASYETLIDTYSPVNLCHNHGVCHSLVVGGDNDHGYYYWSCLPELGSSKNWYNNATCTPITSSRYTPTSRSAAWIVARIVLLLLMLLLLLSTTTIYLYLYADPARRATSRIRAATAASRRPSCRRLQRCRHMMTWWWRRYW